LATRSLLYTIHRAAEGLGLETCDEAAGTLHRGSCGAGAGARGGIVYNTGLWLERVRILHAICRTEQSPFWRGSSGSKNRFRFFRVRPQNGASASEAGDGTQWKRAVAEFWGLTRLTLDPAAVS